MNWRSCLNSSIFVKKDLVGNFSGHGVGAATFIRLRIMFFRWLLRWFVCFIMHQTCKMYNFSSFATLTNGSNAVGDYSPANDSHRLMTNGDEGDDMSEISDLLSFNECSDAAHFSCGVSLGVNEANRSTVETKVHNLLDLYAVSLSIGLVLDAVSSVSSESFLSAPGTISLSSISNVCRNDCRFLVQIGALNTGVYIWWTEKKRY